MPASQSGQVKTWFESVATTEFPQAWEDILQNGFALYRLLPERDRQELRSYIKWFLSSKSFEGCGGLVITDEIRVTVAAQACLLLLRRTTPCYERLRLVRVYPSSCFAVSSSHQLAGESWDSGVVLLAWDAVRAGAANPSDGYNLVLHEFAHQLDQEEGPADGIPRLGRGNPPPQLVGMYTAWAKMLAKEFEDFRLSVDQRTERVMDAYGATDPGEFFAVATECFFEKPKQLRERQPELYAALKQFYKQDPSRWGEPASDSPQTAEPVGCTEVGPASSAVSTQSPSSPVSSARVMRRKRERGFALLFLGLIFLAGGAFSIFYPAAGLFLRYDSESGKYLPEWITTHSSRVYGALSLIVGAGFLWIDRWPRWGRRRTAIDDYVWGLSQDLARRLGVKRYYTIEEVCRVAKEGGYHGAYLAYAHAAFCHRAAFNEYYGPLRLRCTYDGLRQIIADRYLDGARGFDAADVVRLARPPWEEEYPTAPG